MQDYKILPLKYNTHPYAVDVCKKSKTCEELFQNSGDDLLKEAIALHYATPDKPWKTKKVSTANKFWEMVPYTDFKDEIINIYQENAIARISKSVNSINKLYERKIKCIYILLGVIIGCNVALLLFLSRKKII